LFLQTCAQKYDPRALFEHVRNSPLEFILQNNDAEKHLLSASFDIANITILFDGSAGTAKNPDRSPPSLNGFRCVYAGDLNPPYLPTNLASKSGMPGAHTARWVDAETGCEQTIDSIPTKFGPFLRSRKTIYTNRMQH
jgi:hypothetical protein